MNYKQASDIDLWHCCQQDDKRALAELFDRYFPRVYALTSRNINDSMVAEELAMDLFFKLWQKRSDITITSNVPAYLLRSAKNIVINHLQKQRLVYTSVELVPEQHLMASVRTDEHILSSEIEDIYRNALNELSPQRREVFMLSREENLTYAEIAERMNLSVNTVKNYISVALVDMRNSMSDYTVVVLFILSCIL